MLIVVLSRAGEKGGVSGVIYPGPQGIIGASWSKIVLYSKYPNTLNIRL